LTISSSNSENEVRWSSLGHERLAPESPTLPSESITEKKTMQHECAAHGRGTPMQKGSCLSKNGYCYMYIIYIYIYYIYIYIYIY